MADRGGSEGVAETVSEPVPVSIPGHVAAVVGWPVAHSMSPRLHSFWLQEQGLDGTYLALPVAPDGFETAIRGLAAAGFRGLNVTVPHKLRAYDIADRRDSAAEAIGAVNTLVFHADGTIEGRNTDSYGFIENLLRHGVDPAAGPALLIGAGGAARAAVHGLLAAGCPQVRIANRTRATAETLVQRMQDADPAARGERLRVVDMDAVADAMADAALLVNTTSLGMKGQPPLPLDPGPLPDHAVVHDIVYVPLQTGLLAAAAARGLKTVDGLGMLLHQAEPAFEAFFGVSVRVTEELRNQVVAGLGQ